MPREKKVMDCPHCKGTGKIEICPLCRGSGFVSENLKSPKNGMTAGWVSVPCPNGCGSPKVTLQDG